MALREATYVKDTFIRGGRHADRNENSRRLATRSSNDPTWICRALLKFDTQGTIPQGAHIVSAALTLTVRGGSGPAGRSRTLKAYRVTEPFREDQATWNDRESNIAWRTPGAHLGEPVATAKATNVAGSTVTFNVTSVVQAAVNRKFGSRWTRLALIDDGRSTNRSYREYHSSEAKNPSVRPVLTVLYASTSSSDVNSCNCSSGGGSESGSESASKSGSVSGGGSGTTTGRVLWSADHETADLSQWYVDGGGGEFNSGVAWSVVSEDVAHSGRYSVKADIITPGESGVRLFRWNESRAHPEGAYYSAWFYFPQNYTPRWWNIFQFKSRNGSRVNDPFWFLQIGNRPGRAMYLFLYWWNGLTIEGPRQGEFGGRSFTQALRDVPVGRWTHIEVFLRQSSAFDGHIIVWQDGVELFNLSSVRTRYAASNGANEWSVNNYSGAILPSPTTIYIDDAVIGTSRVGR